MKAPESSSRVWAFFMLTFAWSWTCWLVSLAIKPQSPPLATTLMFVGSFGPSLAAVVVVANAGGRTGLRAWLGRCLQWPKGWRQGWLLVFGINVDAPNGATHPMRQTP